MAPKTIPIDQLPPIPRGQHLRAEYDEIAKQLSQLPAGESLVLSPTTNNAYDTILLVNDLNFVVSQWPATPERVRDYLANPNGDQWEVQRPKGWSMEWEDVPVSDYGREIGRDGHIDDRERFEFWMRSDIVASAVRR